MAEGGRFNINTILLRNDTSLLRDLFISWGLDLDTAQGVTACLGDWIDADDDVSLNGAEKDWYESRSARPAIPCPTQSRFLFHRRPSADRPTLETREMSLPRGPVRVAPLLVIRLFGLGPAPMSFWRMPPSRKPSGRRSSHGCGRWMATAATGTPCGAPGRNPAT